MLETSPYPELVTADRFSARTAHAVMQERQNGREMLMNTAAGRDQFAALVGVLRQERAAMDWLAFKLSEAELLTGSGEGRFLAMIVDEVDEIADELGTIEVARAMIVAELCDTLGKAGEDDISLSDLIAYAPADIGAALTDLRTELIDLADHLTATAARGTASAQTRKAAITATLNNLEPATHGKTGYDQWGARSTVAPIATRINEVL